MSDKTPERDAAYVKFADSLPVYFAYSEALKLVKIGFSSNVRSRVSALRGTEMRQDFDPGKCVLVGWLIGGPLLEAELHEQFAESHVRGEWFTPSPEMADLIDEEGEEGEPPVMQSEDGFRVSARGYWSAVSRLTRMEQAERVVHDFGDGRQLTTREMVPVDGTKTAVLAQLRRGFATSG